MDAMKKNKVTMQQIADLMNISKVSVSKALGGREGISEELRREILSVARDMDYISKTKVSDNRFKFAFLVSKKFFLENENFYSTIYYYLNKIVQKDRHELIVYVLNYNEIINLILPKQLIESSFDGIFIAGELSKNYIENLQKIKTHMTFIDFDYPELETDCVVSDNFSIGYDATMNLIVNGHKKIGFAGNIKETNSTIDRYYGFRKALYISDIEYDEKFNVENKNIETGIYLLNHEMPKDLPTAFVCSCDMSAYFLSQKLTQMGLNVPNDISIISIDNTDLSKISSPALSTIDINKEAFASVSFKSMINRINGCQFKQKSYISHTIIPRDSVKNINI